jgi:hypothetical protein
MQPELQNLVKKLAVKYNRPVSEIEKILDYPTIFASRTMASGDREKREFFNIRIPAFGIFYARKAYVWKINEIVKKKKEKEELCKI